MKIGLSFVNGYFHHSPCKNVSVSLAIEKISMGNPKAQTKNTSKIRVLLVRFI